MLSNFDEAKSCLKKAVKISQENSQLAETEADQRKINAGTLVWCIQWNLR